MSPSELRSRSAELNKEQDKALDEVERRVTGEFRQKFRALFQQAGEQTSVAAELEDAYYDFFPVKSELPEGARLVEIDL
jgi:hypothetical protein